MSVAPGFEVEALGLLRQLTGDPVSVFRPDQVETIERLVEQRQRVFLVQRTGWGKSAVYFVATSMLRDRQRGPTLLISPLLALMRNQIEAANHMGVRAETINSDIPRREWEAVRARIEADQVDVLLVSPERLSNPWFRKEIIPSFGRRTGLLVIDEAHCISDWGHDFRPDYRRIVRVLDSLPRGIPVLCCTATANDRVVEDVVHQVGRDLQPVRGPLGREGLRLHVLDIPNRAERLVWLSETIPELGGTGIVYCLTIDDTEEVAGWLKDNGIRAVAYSSRTDPEESREIEQALLANEVDVVVATSALGMGFDKPDLSFVIHYQAPSSPIAYYQQVGRAGRSLELSWGVLLRGSEDKKIQDHFIETAFPRPELAEAVVAYLATSGDWCSISELERFNHPQKEILHLMTVLTVDEAVEADGWKWRGTPNRWRYDHDRAEKVTELRYREQQEMVEYAETTGCRMAFLRRSLDDPDTTDCGCCDNCDNYDDDEAAVESDGVDTGGAEPFPASSGLAREFAHRKVAQANEYLLHRYLPIQERKQWPDKSAIPGDRRLQEGKVLSRWADGGWGDLVKNGKQVEGRFDQQLVDAAAEMITEHWRPDPRPAWVTYVPSSRSPGLVSDFAHRLATELNLACRGVIEKTRETDEQKTKENSSQQYSNIKGAFTINGPLPDGPVLLVDDIVDSKWTLTEIGYHLLEAGSGPVVPFALASTAKGSK